MKLPGIKDLPISGKNILLRTNYDVPLKEGRILDNSRIEESLPTIKYLLKKKAKVVILSHLGRPQGKKDPALSLKPVIKILNESLGKKVKLVDQVSFDQPLVLRENLRFDPGEKANNLVFAKKLVQEADYYINDAFACSHRHHASIVAVPKLLPKKHSAFGLDFLEEFTSLNKVRLKPKRPLVVILGGKKKDKLKLVENLESWADWILIGGKLIDYDGISDLVSRRKIEGKLAHSGDDITPPTIKKFKEIIKQAKTIVWSGPLGFYENPEFEKGTKEIAQVVVKSGAFSVVGGGDTEAAFSRFGLVDKVDYVSSGGGAMLTFLAKGTLPGIEAIKETYG